jgi:two-component system, sensor histidine kinase and response regulator
MQRRFLKILVVDDEPGMCKGAKRVLENYAVALNDIGETVSFQIDYCESGGLFFSRLESGAPDITLLDCKLPDMDGIDILGRLSAMKLEMLTIMVTAYATLETAVRATKLGAHDFLAKPFSPEELRYTVSKAARDITLIRKTRQLTEERRQVRFQFLSTLAHELKAPLNAVDGYLDLLVNRGFGDDAVKRTEMLVNSRKRIGGMRRMIEDLLDLTRIESGRKKRNFEKVNLTDAARSVTELHARAAAEAGVTVAVNGDPGAALVADKGEMEMIIGNLVSNAIKYNRRGGSVDVSVGRGEGDTLIVAVADTGIGMSPEEAAGLFVEFSRVKNDKTRGIAGSGLGLSIVKHIALLYGGDVRVTSVPGEGSRFEVLLKPPVLPQ